MRITIIFFTCLINFSIYSIAQPGTLDPTFGNNGIAIGSKDLAESNSIALQKDGKIIAASGGFINSTYGFTLSRHNTDGIIDLSFGSEGLVFTAMQGFGAMVESVKIQDDGKIIAAGYNINHDEYGSPIIDIVVTRYDENGSLDNSFGVNGIATTNIGIVSYATCMALQKDGKIVVAGTRKNDENDTRNLFMVRFLTSGTVDESFADKGKLLEFFSSPISLNSIAIQPEDQKIVLGGMYTTSEQGAYFLNRYLPDGSRNNGFGINGQGKIMFGTGSSASILNEINLQVDGKIVAAGRSYNPSTSTRMTVVRFKTNGTADSSFGKNGITYIQFDNDRSEARSVLIQTDGKIISSGFRYPANYSYIHFALARLKSNGSLDSTFGVNGQTTDIIVDDFTAPYDGLLQNDGKLVLAGGGGLANALILVRYNIADAILPIIYSKFSATQTKATITLNWQTTTELNNSYFAVERSSNAVNYTGVAQVKSKATNGAAQDYAYTDKLPLVGTNYYRLKQVDKDGKFSYSKTLSIAYLKPGSIQVFPNPAKDKLTVKGLNAAIISTITVLDIQGKQLLQFTAKAAAYSFSIGSLAPGTYIVRVKDANGIAVEKFVKQ